MAGRQIKRAMAALAVMLGVYAATLYQPAVTVPTAAEPTVQTVTLQALGGAAVEMDQCDSAQQARISAARLVNRGSAGYVHFDGGYRVLGALFVDEAEANAMCEKLNAGGMKVQCYPCVGQTLTLKVTGEPRQIEALTAAIHAVDMAVIQPENIAQQLDSAQIDSDRARGLVAMLVRDLETAQADFRDTGAQGGLSEPLDALITETIAALEPLTQTRADSALTLAGQIRCAGISVFFQREAMLSRFAR